MHMNRKSIYPMALAAILAAGATEAAETKLLKLQLLTYNDFHGNMAAPAGSDAKMRETEDPLQHDLGGIEYLATTLSNLRQKAKHSITACAGDLIGGSPMFSGMFHDEPTVQAMESLGLDVCGVGNHEFEITLCFINIFLNLMAVTLNSIPLTFPYYGILVFVNSQCPCLPLLPVATTHPRSPRQRSTSPGGRSGPWRIRRCKVIWRPGYISRAVASRTAIPSPPTSSGSSAST